jgi:[ribosomal protein S5]-alanine N-acetyltransferase
MKRVAARHLLLEPLTHHHAREMFSVLSDPAIYEFENEPPASEEALARRYARLEAGHSPDGSETWLNWVIRPPSGELAGYVQATVLPSGIAYIAYILASRYWRQGLGRAAVTTMLAELQTNHAVNVFVAVLKARNDRSSALLERLGFSPASPDQLAVVEPKPDEIVMVKLAG